MKRVLHSLYASKCTVAAKFAAVRAISQQVFLTCAQLRRILGLFEGPDKVEIFVSLFARLVDLQNDKLWRAHLAITEAMAIQERLGKVTTFPFIQPENSRFELNLEFHDERLCASLLKALDLKELSGQNLYDCKLVHASGKQDKLQGGLPGNWEEVENVPESGNLEAAYKCAPDDRDFAGRKELALKFGGFKVEAKDKTMQWWSGLQEAPPDVLELLEFAQGAFASLEAAFDSVAEPADGGEVKLKHFVKGLQALNFRRFSSGPGAEEDEVDNEVPRMRKVFKYFDTVGEGTLTLSLWLAGLAPFWAESELCIQEFVAFCECTLGGLSEAWTAIAAGSDSVLFEEGAQRIGYFGTLRPVEARFGVLDGQRRAVGRTTFLKVLKPYRSMPGSPGSPKSPKRPLF